MQNVSKLSSSSLVVNLSLSVWTGRKLDKRVSEEVDQQKSTKTRAGNYTKNLFAGSGKLEELTKLSGAIRTWLYNCTQPWGDNGDRLLPMTSLTEYKARLTDYEQQFALAVHVNLGTQQCYFSCQNCMDEPEYLLPLMLGALGIAGFLRWRQSNKVPS